MLLPEEYFDKQAQVIEDRIHSKRVERNWKLTSEEVIEIIKEGLLEACTDQITKVKNYSKK
ncbi:MAG: hypothetical protein WC438_05745 [Candidatus Pacearchaeota archaeon]|jgi:hypothetical protein